MVLKVDCAWTELDFLLFRDSGTLPHSRFTSLTVLWRSCFLFILFLSLDPHPVTKTYPILCISFGALQSCSQFESTAYATTKRFTFFPGLIFLLISVKWIGSVQGQKTQASACEGRRAKAGGEQGKGHRASSFTWKWAVRPSQAQTCNFTRGSFAADTLILCYVPCRLVLTAICSLSVIIYRGSNDWAIMWYRVNIKNSKRKLSWRPDIKCV